MRECSGAGVGSAGRETNLSYEATFFIERPMRILSGDSPDEAYSAHSHTAVEKYAMLPVYTHAARQVELETLGNGTCEQHKE